MRNCFRRVLWVGEGVRTRKLVHSPGPLQNPSTQLPMRLTLLTAACVALAATLPTLPSDSLAGTAQRMDIEALVDTAELVLEGRVIMSRTLRDSEGMIVTDYELEVQRTFLGEHMNRRSLRLPGGLLECGEGLMVPGLPSMGLGEDVILALSAPGVSGVRLPTGLTQGKFKIMVGTFGLPVAVRDGSGSTLVTPQGQAVDGGMEVMPYAELVARIQAAANTQEQGR